MDFHADALLPTAERYASLKFRRYSRWFRPTRLDWDDAVELVAFVEAITPKAAAFVFHWGHAGVRAYARLAKHVLAQDPAVSTFNDASISVDDGLAVLDAMRDGGYTGYGLPPIVRRSLGQLYHEGTSLAKLVKRTGLSRDQVKYALDRRYSQKRVRADAFSALGTG